MLVWLYDTSVRAQSELSESFALLFLCITLFARLYHHKSLDVLVDPVVKQSFSGIVEFLPRFETLLFDLTAPVVDSNPFD